MTSLSNLQTHQTHTLQSPPPPSPPHLDPEDPHTERGRKRRRSSAANNTTTHLPSNTLRGRARRRSSSLGPTSNTENHEREASPDRNKPPLNTHYGEAARKYIKVNSSLVGVEGGEDDDDDDDDQEIGERMKIASREEEEGDRKGTTLREKNAQKEKKKKKRDQSPSRSRSEGQEGDSKPRRRQRTRSRSRSHGGEFGKESRILAGHDTTTGITKHSGRGKSGQQLGYGEVEVMDDDDEIAVED